MDYEDAAQSASAISGEGGDATLKKIYESAKRNFTTHGYDRTSMESIALDAGVSKQILYYYFEGKSEIYNIVFNDMGVDAHREVFDFDFDALAPISAIRALFEMSFESKQAGSRLPTAEAIRQGGCMIKKGSDLQRAGLKAAEIFKRIIERGQQDGTIRKDIDPVFVHVLTWLLHAGFLSSRDLLEKYIGTPLSGSEVSGNWKSFASDALISAIASEKGKAAP